MNSTEEPRSYSSPPCFLHELGALTWPEVTAWRAEKRKQLLSERRAMGAAARRRSGRLILGQLLGIITPANSPVLGIYWPIRAEIDMFELARRHIQAGGEIALPVVVQKQAPVEFWRWRPGIPMQRGFWNIPVPRDREPVVPDALVVPLVGFDRAGYRLGYGGGYYDRTLAAAAPRPRTYGVGLASAELETIHPQPHDIRMDAIVTDRVQAPAAAASGPP